MPKEPACKKAGLAACRQPRQQLLLQVRTLGQLPRASTVAIEPASESDWEMVELNAAFLELNILQQVSIYLEACRAAVLWVMQQSGCGC